MTNNLVPKYTWIDDKIYQFKIPMTINGMKDVKIKTHTFGGKEVWAKISGNDFSVLPSNLYLKNIIFGVIYKNEKEIDWYDSQQNLDSTDIDSFCFKGKAMTNTYRYEETYNPYTIFSKFQLNSLIRDKNIQESLWRLVEKYKYNGTWNTMTNTNLYIGDVCSTTSKNNMWKILTKNLSLSDFIIPNPAISLKIHGHNFNRNGIPNGGEETFRFLFTNAIQTQRQTLTEWINQNPAPKPIESADDWGEWLDDLSTEEREELIEEDTPF